MSKREIFDIVMHCDAMVKTKDQDELNHFYENYWRLKPNQIDLFQGLTDEYEIVMTLCRKVKGWRNPPYHRYIKGDGSVKEMFDFDRISNGVGGHNSDIINICYHGGVIRVGDRYEDTHDTRTKIQKSSELDCIMEAILYSNNAQIRIKGHRDFSPDRNGDGKITSSEWLKTCPNYDVQSNYGWITV